ncbi:MAG TPA: hypothetical protein VHI52_14200 [Verrucomicrobiae bacterium]|nr:hypothetical protein [Verrucomicrobiae bacterium]
MNAVALDLKFAGIDLRDRQIVQPRVFHVHDTTAIEANEVVMRAQTGIESCRRTRMARTGHQTEGGECAENAMDCHPRDLGEPTLDVTVKLLRCRMITTILDRFKDRAALAGDRQTALAVGGKKASQSLFLV